MLIKVTGYELKRGLGVAPMERPPVTVKPPVGVSNWKRISGPHDVPGGQKMTIRAQWKCFEGGIWRTLYDDGSVGTPVTPKGPFRLWRGSPDNRNLFEFSPQEPVNPRLLGEVVTFDLEMMVMTDDVRRRVS